MKQVLVVGHRHQRSSILGLSADPLEAALIESGFKNVVFYDNRGSLKKLLGLAVECYCVILREPLFREPSHYLLETVQALREMDPSQIILVTFFPSTQPTLERELRAAGVNEVFVGPEETEAVSLAAAEKRRRRVPIAVTLSATGSTQKGGRGRPAHLARQGPAARDKGNRPVQGQLKGSAHYADTGRYQAMRNQLVGGLAKRSTHR